ncbi:hypothetical protein [uncultured Clostridium sp.]|uniref:hypothetical protein n=1 Tax=uncultured Clostridium sp. TaxID=59620 RepID=UPI0025CE523F|nr:hypothetical protein [uncultured Clostridium sp.]
MGAIIDVGTRAMYNYHVNKTLNNGKVDEKIINAWKPTSAEEEKIYILNRILEKAKGYDGVKVMCRESEFPLLFLTNGWDCINLKSGKTIYQANRTRAMMNARSRFEDFKRRGLIEGNIGSLAITFMGKEILEQKIDVKQVVQKEMDEFTEKLEEYIETSGIERKKIIDGLNEIRKEKYDTLSRGMILSNVIGNLSNIVTLINGIPETVQIVSTGLRVLYGLKKNL